MLRRYQKNFRLLHALILLATLEIYFKANEIYNLNAVIISYILKYLVQTYYYFYYQIKNCT